MSHDHFDNEFDGDFKSDMGRMFPRRAVLLGLGVSALAAPLNATSHGTCIASPETTRGPFPADGRRASGQRINILDKAGVIRRDIRGSIAGLAGTAEGAQLDLTIEVSDSRESCAPLAGKAVYIWQCDAAGDYSIYGIENQNYLRGMQVTDADGLVTFTTIVPGTYRGRWPHIHYEVFDSIEDAERARRATLVGQFAFEGNFVRDYYTQAAIYDPSIVELDRLTLARDGVFRRYSTEELKSQTVAVRSATDTLATAAVSISVA